MSKGLFRACLLLVGVAGAPAGAQTGSATLSFSPFTFTAADGSKTEADSATLVVPKNRQHPERGTVTIPVVRFRATGGGAGAGAPIVYLSTCGAPPAQRHASHAGQASRSRLGSP